MYYRYHVNLLYSPKTAVITASIAYNMSTYIQNHEYLQNQASYTEHTVTHKDTFHCRNWVRVGVKWKVHYSDLCVVEATSFSCVGI